MYVLFRFVRESKSLQQDNDGYNYSHSYKLNGFAKQLTINVSPIIAVRHNTHYVHVVHSNQLTTREKVQKSLSS